MAEHGGWPRSTGLRSILAALALGSALWPSLADAESGFRPSDERLRRIVEAFARSSVDDGTSVGVAVGVTFRGQRHLFAYGLADATSGTLVTPDTIFQIGSVTKVFTTAILGENVLLGINRLSQTLADFTTQLGPLHPRTQAVTLQELGNFTAGLPSTPEECTSPHHPPGCLPNGRPTIAEYGAQDFATYFDDFRAQKLPAHYDYSDISTGIIGLLLGANRKTPLADSALQGWLDLVEERITTPLGMRDTFLFPEQATSDQVRRQARGYEQALATAGVSASGVVEKIDLESFGKGYASEPLVTIRGGGGAGATAQANIVDRSVTTIDVVDGGHDYVASPKVTFSGSGGAKAQAIVVDGRVVAIRILVGGTGYSTDDLPTVTITGGTRGAQARDAVLAPASVSNGSVDFVRVLDGGRGYVEPIAVIVAPGEPTDNPIPIWAPAGALSSSARDMLALAEAALGHIVGRHFLLALWLNLGFRVAQIPSVCNVPNQDPCLAFTGLAWEITPRDGGVGAIITKNGGLDGFSSEVRLLPALDLGVVVFVNSRQKFEEKGKPSKTAGNIADSILYTIARGGLR
jgi:CubicO group peptidase (beta-lactamase class C family)